MRNVRRKLAFVLAASNHGTMIVNRFDRRTEDEDISNGVGVGFQLLEGAAFDPQEVELAVQLLELRRHFHGDGVTAVDCGANIGVHTVEWATAMTGWGSVVATEAQERIYYALAGNITINNCFNAIAMHGAVAAEGGIMNIPTPDYFTASSFGSLELREGAQNEFIGQAIDYSQANSVPIQKIPLDALNLARLDLIKIDVEGMEMEALEGARTSIEKHHPILLVESIKTSREDLRGWMAARGYQVIEAGLNVLAIHNSDPVLSKLNRAEPVTQASAA